MFVYLACLVGQSDLVDLEMLTKKTMDLQYHNLMTMIQMRKMAISSIEMTTSRWKKKVIIIVPLVALNYNKMEYKFKK